MNKISIALDILRQYNEYLEVSGKEIKIYAIDGYGERVSFKALVYGYWCVFSSIYGSSDSWYGYPKNMYWNKLWGDGIIGWNRPVSNPAIDIPKALTIYTQLNAPASSYKDKFSRQDAFKKLFYRDGSHYNNVFIDTSIQVDDNNYIQKIGYVLQQEDPDFYKYVISKLQNLYTLASNEAKNVSVPTKLKYLFDNKPVATMYDDQPTDESYKDGLLNMNSATIQANQFYLTFLTSFEQIIYQYTKQTFPIKLLGTLTNLYSSYIKLIINYVKPYHAKLIDLAPVLRLGTGLEETVAVGDVLRLDPTVQIFSDVVKWNFDNPYDYRPEEYDQLDKVRDEFWFGGKPSEDESEEWNGIIYGEDAPESGIVYKIEDKEHYYHRIDDVKIYTDNKYHQNDLYEDINMTVDSNNTHIKPYLDEIPFEIYPSSLYNRYRSDWLLRDPLDSNNYKVYEDLINFGITKEDYQSLIDTGKIVKDDLTSKYFLFSTNTDGVVTKNEIPIRYSMIESNVTIEDFVEYNFLNNHIENISDRDLCIITKPYNYKYETRLSNIKFNEVTYDIDISNTKIGILVNDISHLMVYTDNTWKTIKLPVISDIFNRIDPPNTLSIPCRHLSANSTFLTNLSMPNRYYNFIKFFLYIPAHSKAILPEIDYVGRLKHY